MFASSVDSCFWPFGINAGISIRIPRSFKTDSESRNPLSTTKMSSSLIHLCISSVFKRMEWFRIEESLFFGSARYGPRTLTIYPVVETIIIGFKSGRRLCILNRRNVWRRCNFHFFGYIYKFRPAPVLRGQLLCLKVDVVQVALYGS